MARVLNRHGALQCITTRYLNPTNFRGGRIKASARGGRSIIVDYPHDATNQEDAHTQIAMALADKLGWRDHWYVGGNGDGGYTFVQLAHSDMITESRLCDIMTGPTSGGQARTLARVVALALGVADTLTGGK